MEKREETHKEVLLEATGEASMSRDALVEQCHRALSAHLWMTCCWSDGGATAKIGDFNYLIASVAPDAETSLYVQFWSEPGEVVLMEVGSGAWCPGAIRYIGSAQRKVLEARGYTRGGRARNYTKELVIDSAEAAEAVALEVLDILFEVFKYRGQWQFDIERHRGERAEHEPVFTSVTPEDFAKVAARAGCQATVDSSGDLPHVALRQGKRAFLACMDARVPGQNLYSVVDLQAELTLLQPVSDAAIARANATMRFVKVWRTDRRAVRIQMPLVLDGGVTEAWLEQSLEQWLLNWRACERRLQSAVGPARSRSTSPGAELIH